MPAHYAPKTRLLLAKPEALEAYAAKLCAEGKRVAVLHPYPLVLPEGAEWVCLPEDVPQRAHGLYAALHALDNRRFDFLLTSLPEDKGLGSALGDRLMRAAHAHR
jgi:L-threonylcarbamoyladenylate synthase